MNKAVAALAGVAALALLAQAPAHARQGFGSDTEQGQGNLGNKNVQDNPGTVTETTTGPSGALKNDKTTPNQTTTTSGPGNKKQSF